MFSIVLNVKALVGAMKQKKALIEAFIVIVKTDGSFAALLVAGADHQTSRPQLHRAVPGVRPRHRQQLQLLHAAAL